MAGWSAEPSELNAVSAKQFPSSLCCQLSLLLSCFLADRYDINERLSLKAQMQLQQEVEISQGMLDIDMKVWPTCGCCWKWSESVFIAQGCYCPSVLALLSDTGPGHLDAANEYSTYFFC